jgi:hypothetical protein
MTRKRVWARGYGSIFSKLFFQLPFSSALTLDQRLPPTTQGLNAISVGGFDRNQNIILGYRKRGIQMEKNQGRKKDKRNLYRQKKK